MTTRTFNQMDWFFGPSSPGETKTGTHVGTRAPRLYRRPRSGVRRFWDYMTGQGPAQLPAVTAPITAVQAPVLGIPTTGGSIVQGTPGQTQRELLATPTQTTFTRTTDVVDVNIPWNDWRRLKEMLPVDFNEAKYIQNNPDIAKAVSAGVMPSGAWHYVMYGMPGCQANQKEGAKCEARSFAGWRRGLGNHRTGRRPGYLAGYSMWS